MSRKILLGALASVVVVAPGARAAEPQVGKLRGTESARTELTVERPRFEFLAQTGYSFPGNHGDEGYEIGHGPSLGAGALYRPVSWFALGPLVDVSRFSWDDHYFLAAVYGVSLRLYAVMPAASELYLGALFGGTSYATSRATNTCLEPESVSPTVGAFFGVDGGVSRSFRIGGQVGYQGVIVASPLIECKGPPLMPSVSPGLTLRLVGTFMIH